MNELIINPYAPQLKATVIVENEVSIANKVPLSVSVDEPVTIANHTPLRVNGTVNISEPIAILNQTPLKVNGAVSISEPVTISNEKLQVVVAGSIFISDEEQITNALEDGYIFNNKDISGIRTATIFIENTGVNNMTFSLELSTDGTLYVDDPGYTDVELMPNQKTIVILGVFSKFIRLKYSSGGGALTFKAFFNAQS